MEPIILYKDYKYYYINQDKFLKMTMGEKLYYDITNRIKKSVISFSSFKDLCLDFLFGTFKINKILNQVENFCKSKDVYTLLSKENNDILYNNTKIKLHEDNEDYFMLSCDKIKIKLYKKIKILITIDKYSLVINKKYLKD